MTQDLISLSTKSHAAFLKPDFQDKGNIPPEVFYHKDLFPLILENFIWSYVCLFKLDYELFKGMDRVSSETSKSLILSSYSVNPEWMSEWMNFLISLSLN